MIAEYTRILNDQHIEKLEALRNAFQGFDANPQQGIGGQTLGGQGTRPKWSSIEEMNAALTAQRKAQEAARPKPVDKAARLQEIEHELDIIRGVVPTPRGYTIDKAKIRGLIKELEGLKS